MFACVGEALTRSLDELADVAVDDLVGRRYEKLRAIGEFCTLDEG
jgi:acetyl-CoA carboxylase alpha subunit